MPLDACQNEYPNVLKCVKPPVFGDDHSFELNSQRNLCTMPMIEWAPKRAGKRWGIDRKGDAFMTWQPLCRPNRLAETKRHLIALHAVYPVVEDDKPLDEVHIKLQDGRNRSPEPKSVVTDMYVHITRRLGSWPRAHVDLIRPACRSRKILKRSSPTQHSSIILSSNAQHYPATIGADALRQVARPV